MNSTTALENAYNEVLQKVGRNLLIFQQAELLIKRLRSIGSLSARPGEAYESIEKRASTCEKMTLGQVVKHRVLYRLKQQLPLSPSPIPDARITR